MSRRKQMKYRCNYCGHEQAQLYGSYLCPVCRHAIIPIKKQRFSKQARIALRCVLVCIVIALGLFVVRPAWPRIVEAYRDLRDNVPASTQAETEDYCFSDERVDMLISQIDGHQHYQCSGSVSCSKVGLYYTTLTFDLYMNNQKIYTASENLGVMLPSKEYPFNFDVDLSDYVNESALTGARLHSRITAQGHGSL